MTVAALRPFDRSTVGIIARKELRDAMRNRWFWLYAIGFAGLAAILANLALPGSTVAGYGAFGRSASSLIALVQLIVPLMGLTLGAQALAGQQERGTLRFLLSHPVSRTEAFVGTYLGLVIALFATVLAGFGVAGLVTGLRGSAADAMAFGRIALLSWMLAAAMLGLGLAISSFTRRTGVALGSALFTWLILVFLGDLGLMGTAVTTELPVSTLFVSVMLNPVEGFRLAALTAFQGSLDVLGPSGTYAIDRFGSALDPMLFVTLGAWVVVPAWVAWRRFKGRKDL